MGRKNKRKGNQKNRRNQQALPPLSEEFKQNLYLEALEGIDKMKQSKDLFLNKLVKEAYILSKQWLDAWKIHVGYDAVLRGEQPCGKKYGRQQIQEINKDLVANQDLFHEAHETHYYFDPPLKELQPVKDFILITQDAWHYFAEKYKGIEIRRIANEKGEFDLKLISPYIIFLTQEKIAQILSFNTNQMAGQTELLRMRKVQMNSEWTYKDLVMYCSQYMEAQNLQIWQMNPIFEHAQVKLQLLKTINTKKNILLGEQILENVYSNYQLYQFIKNNTILVIAQNDIEFSEMEFKFELNQGGCCFTCGSKSQLNYCCACKRVFYCSDTCRYKDQEFHSKFCVKAYDSQDDEDFDNISYDEIKDGKGAGLVNLGNTCYMNSSLQSILSSSHFQQFLSNKHYWTENTLKRNVQIVYKLEKLLKNLLTHQKAVSPYSFRQQFARKFPIFGNNFQQDAAEFILYLFDAMNEELLQKVDQPIKQDFQIDLGDVDQPTAEQISESDEEDSGDEQENTQIIDQSQQAKFNKKDKGNIQQQINNDNFEQALEQIQKQNSQLMNNNFLGITKSEVECPICTTKNYSYEQFLMLPLSLNAACQQKNLIDIFVVFDDWYKPYQKITFEYQPNQTLLMDLKRDIGEKLNIIPSFLLGTICGSSTIESYLFHDEDSISKIIKDNPNSYFCLFQLDQDSYAVTDEDQYFDITIFSYEKKTAYSYQCENIPASIPKIMVVKKSSTALQIYQQIWQKLGEFSHSQQIEIPEEVQQADILNPQQIKDALTYSMMIETRLTAKTNCPFTCGKSYKKEQKQHSCELPFNNSSTLDQYLEKLNYKNAHTSLLIEFQENAIPDTLRIQFEPKVNYQSKEKSLQLEDLINNFQCKEPLIDENAYNCSTCNDLTFAIKTLQIQRWPDQLIVQLKRFQFDERKGFQKNNTLVTYPENFTYNGINYSLYGVVQHFGGLENGHYTAFGLRNNQWIEFNDEQTKVVQINTVLNDKNAYILFYQQK